GTDIAYLLLYVDDIILTASFKILLQQIITSLRQEFAMTDLGPLYYFMGISVTRDSSGLFLSQNKHVVEILDRTHMVNFQQAGCPTTRRSTSSYYVFLGNNLLSWSSKRQPTLSRSSAEAEYHGVSNAIDETCWLHYLLRELHTPLSFSTLVYCDNVRVLHVSSRYQFADIFTKGLPSALFEEFL
ncbi:ribonuclease H-like domain-containing protein, partial [Tanacetum coccineum]